MICASGECNLSIGRVQMQLFFNILLSKFDVDSFNFQLVAPLSLQESILK